MHSLRLTVATLTPVGRGAVATIRVEGDISQLGNVAIPLFRAAKGRSVSQLELRRIAFGRWGDDNGEEIVASRRSDTTVEFHCHGGDAAVQRILNDLRQAGCSLVSWQSQMLTVGASFDAECLDALSRATTWRTAEILLEQSNGLLSSTIQSLDPVARLSRSSSPNLLLSPSQSPENLRKQTLSELDALLAWSAFGLHLTRPWSVVLTGRPNVGKSSLINRLLGYERAIVFDQPGTTRDVLTAETALDGWPLLLADTAGLRDATEELEAAGIALARNRLETADLRVVLIDLSESPTIDDEQLLTQWSDAIVVAHKCDLPDRWLSRLPEKAMRVSSRTGEGIVELQRRMTERLVPSVPPPGTPIPISVRQVELLKAARIALVERNEAIYEKIVASLIDGSDEQCRINVRLPSQCHSAFPDED